MAELRYRELTYALRGLIFETRNQLKTGWSEEIYHRGLLQLIQANNIPVQSKPRRVIVHRDIEVHTFECDLLVADRVILELKMLPLTGFASAHYAQLISYLKCWRKDLGLLINWGATRPQIERVVWDEPQTVVQENYDELDKDLSASERSDIRQIAQNLVTISAQYGLGYPDTLYRKIVAIELAHDGMACQANVGIPAKLSGRMLGYDPSDHLIVAERHLLNIRALLDYPSRYEFARTKTFLNCLGLRSGLVVNFGKKQLQIFGVNAK